MKSLISAIRTLTIIPIPGKDAKNFSTAIPLFPIPALILAIIPFGMYKLFLYLGMCQWRVASILALFITTALTGFLHVDGLGDVADAFGGGKTKERILDILKDSRMGTFGISAIVFDILFKLYLWEWAFRNKLPYIIVISLLCGRFSQMLFLIFMKSARSDGIAASFIESSAHIKVLSLFSIAVFLMPFYFVIHITFFISSIISFILVTLLAAMFFNNKIQGATGDCLGTVNELVEIVVLLSIFFIFNLANSSVLL